MCPFDQQPANEQDRHTNERDRVTWQVSHVGTATCVNDEGRNVNEDAMQCAETRRTLRRFAGGDVSCIRRACHATTLLYLLSAPSAARGSASSAARCVQLTVSLASASSCTGRETSSVASVVGAGSSLNKVGWVVSEDVDITGCCVLHSWAGRRRDSVKRGTSGVYVQLRRSCRRRTVLLSGLAGANMYEGTRRVERFALFGCRRCQRPTSTSRSTVASNSGTRLYVCASAVYVASVSRFRGVHKKSSTNVQSRGSHTIESSH